MVQFPRLVQSAIVEQSWSLESEASSVRKSKSQVADKRPADEAICVRETKLKGTFF